MASDRGNRVIMNHEIHDELIKILNLDPSKFYRSIEVRAHRQEPVVINVEMYVSKEEGDIDV